MAIISVFLQSPNSWEAFPYDLPFVEESTRDRWIPLTKGQRCGGLVLFCCQPENGAEQVVTLPGIFVHTDDQVLPLW